MVIRLGLAVLLGAGLVADVATAEAPTATLRDGSGVNASRAGTDYLGALRAVDQFLCAWVARDGDSGLRLISQRLRAEVGDEAWLRQFLVGLSNPHHQAFEMEGSGQGDGARYSFRVMLYELSTGQETGAGYEGVIEAVKESGEWRVDRLPRSSER